MKNMGLFLVLLVLLFTACKSKNGISASHKESKTGTKKEYETLSKKLNLLIAKTDNIILYRFIADWIGTPHKIGKCAKSGVDCSCFIRLLFEEVYNQKIPRSSVQMYDASSRMKKDVLKEGDLVFFTIKTTQVSHVGIYLKEGWFAHVSTSKGVMINNLSEKYYAQYYIGAGRF